jgi:hypothetical protein
MKKSIKKQQGMTMITIIIIIVFLLFQGVIAMNVLPVYLTDSNVKSVIERLSDDPVAIKATRAQLKILVAKRLSMNNVYTVKPAHIIVKKGRGEKVVTIEYEPRGKLIGNLEYIVAFKHEARVPIK